MSLYEKIFDEDNLQDRAEIDAWTMPNLFMGGYVVKNGFNRVLPFLPYLRDIWEGRELLFHKPFNKMNSEEFKNYNKLGKQYYKDFLQNNPVNIKDYGEILFSRHNKGKDNTINMEQYPLLRKNLATSEKGLNTNTKNELDRSYDHFSNTFKNNLYDYLIEDINGVGKRYKMMHNKTLNE